jgi:hypothetical protein
VCRPKKRNGSKVNRLRFSSSEVEKEVTWQNLAKIAPPFFSPVLAKASLVYREAQRNVFSVTSKKSRTFHNDGAEYRFKRFIALSGSASNRILLGQASCDQIWIRTPCLNQMRRPCSELNKAEELYADCALRLKCRMQMQYQSSSSQAHSSV